MTDRATRVGTLMLMLLIVAAWMKVGASLDTRLSILALDGQVRTGDTIIDRADWVMDRVARNQLNAVDYFLVTRRTPVLLGLLFSFCGLAGGIAAFWLRTLGEAEVRGRSRTTLLVRLPLAAFAGFLMYLLLQLPAPLLSRLFVGDAIDGLGVSTPEVLRDMQALALLSGLFTTTFFDRVRAFFERLFHKRQPV